MDKVKTKHITLRHINLLPEAYVQADYGQTWEFCYDICFETKSGIRIFLNQSMKINPME